MTGFAASPLGRESLPDAIALLAAAYPFDRAAEVAEEKLFGPSLPEPGWADGLWQGTRLVGVAAGSGRWLRVIAASTDEAHDALLDGAMARARATGASVLEVAAQPGNYLAPGIDVRDGAGLERLRRRGFMDAAENRNLLVRLAGNERTTGARAAALAEDASRHGDTIRRATPADAERVGALAGSFSAAWALEVARADVHVAERGGELVAFAAHDGNNRGLGWFGPAGTLPAHRGRGLGAALLVACLAEIAAAGHETAEIAWVGPVAFYADAVGVSGERRFAVLQRAISDGDYSAGRTAVPS